MGTASFMADRNVEGEMISLHRISVGTSYTLQTVNIALSTSRRLSPRRCTVLRPQPWPSRSTTVENCSICVDISMLSFAFSWVFIQKRWEVCTSHQFDLKVRIWEWEELFNKK